MANIYDANGGVIPVGDGSNFVDYDRTVKGVAHRGFSSVAPENTLPAYRLAKERGFFYVETDVSFTSDGVAVCLHDSTIDRTSNGTGSISSLTWAQVQEYDFGSWKSSVYAGTKIPSFAQFIRLCRDLALHPYIELKSTATYTQAQVDNLIAIVRNNGMQGKVTWISFNATYLGYVKNTDETARLGYLTESLSSTHISTAQGLKLSTNTVFIDTSATSTAAVELCIDAGLPMEVWTIDNADTIEGLNAYITGVTSNSLLAGKVLYDANIT